MTYCDGLAGKDKVCSRMRILLRNKLTNEYYVARRTWTDDPADAFDFRFIVMAEEYARTWRLKDVEVAFAFPAEEPEETLMPLCSGAA